MCEVNFEENRALTDAINQFFKEKQCDQSNRIIARAYTPGHLKGRFVRI